MLIKQIALKNFRQYKDLQVVEFSCDKEKNVTVILGDNTSGKTTLIQAFNWCLYGTPSFKTRELINSETLQEMSMFSSVEVSVEVELQHEDKLMHKRHIAHKFRCSILELLEQYHVFPI